MLQNSRTQRYLRYIKLGAACSLKLYEYLNGRNFQMLMFGDRLYRYIEKQVENNEVDAC